VTETHRISDQPTIPTNTSAAHKFFIEKADDRPNILLLMTDQQRFDTIRAAGYSYMHTPNPICLAARHNPVSRLWQRGRKTWKYRMTLRRTCWRVIMRDMKKFMINFKRYVVYATKTTR